jgi:desumoylating isopeptidase 1
MTSTSPVALLVYDLSQGMARTLSRQLTGKQIDGIWHTAVVVYGKEYCFGQGIEILIPGHSHYGTPIDRINMGTTQIPLDVFREYIDDMKTVWTRDKYHLLDNSTWI